MPKTAFSTLGCPDWTWHDVLHHGPAYGYDGVEIRLLSREVDLLKVADLRPHERATRRRELSDAGFAVCGLASSVRFDFPEQRQLDEQIQIGKAYIELAAELGASFVRVFGDVLPVEGAESERSSAIAQIAEGLDHLGEIAKRTGIEILLETHGDFSSSRNVCDVMSLVGCSAVGVLWDTHHPWRFCRESITETFRQIGKWVRHTHWKDSVAVRVEQMERIDDSAAKQAQELMSGHRPADYVLFGAGEFPAQECMQVLHDAGYQGWFSLEWERMWHPELAGPEIALPPFPRQIRQIDRAVDSERFPPGLQQN